MSGVKKAVIFSFLSNYSSLLIQLCGTMVLARILTPQDFGIFAIAFVFVALANVLKDVGVTQYLIKEKELTTDKIRSAFTILIFFSFSLTVILYLSASTVASFYNEPKLKLIIQLLSINILLSPFGSIVTALLNRNLEFRPTFIASVISQLIGYASMIFLAVKGYGEITLAVGCIISTLATIAVIQFYRPPETPLLPGFGKVKEVLHYSKFVVAASFIGEIGHYYAELAVGKFHSMESVGLLSRALGMADLFNRLFSKALYNVLTPYISKGNREGADIKNNIKIITDIQLSVALPFYAILAFLSEPIIYLLFGSQWTDASLYLTIMCLTVLPYLLSQHFSPIFLGLGLAKEAMKIQLLTNLIRIVIITITVSLGIEQMLYSLFLVTLVGLAYTIYFAKIHLYLDVKDYLCWVLSNSKITCITLMPLLIFFVMKTLVGINNEMVFILVSTLLCGACWCVAVWNKTVGILFRSHFFNGK